MKRKTVYVASLTCLLMVLISSAYSLLHQESGFKLGINAMDTFSAKIVEDAFDTLPDADGNGIKDVMENLTPRTKVTLDPVIVSTASNKMWAIIKVSMPTVTSTLQTDDGKTVHDVFTFTPSADYELLSSNVSDTSGTPSVYYYGLKTELTKNQKSTPLFTEVTVNDFSENEEISSADISITGIVMQSEAVPGVSAAFEETGEF